MMGTTSHKSCYFKKYLICQDCQLLARHWISCLPQTEMSSICWINAPFVHIFTAEVWTKSLVVCRQQLHKDSQKVSCSGLDRQEAKAFLSWKHSLPISQHPFQSYKNLWRRTSLCNPSQSESAQARHIFGKEPSLLGGPGFWHPPWLSREERINKILLRGTTMLPNGIVPFPIRVVFPISICCILQSPFVGKHIHGSLQGARTTHQQLEDWNCAWSLICHAKTVLFLCFYYNTERLWEAGSCWQLAQQFFHRYLFLNKKRKVGNSLSDFCFFVWWIDSNNDLKHLHCSLPPESLWDLTKDSVTVRLWIRQYYHCL